MTSHDFSFHSTRRPKSYLYWNLRVAFFAEILIFRKSNLLLEYNFDMVPNDLYKLVRCSMKYMDDKIFIKVESCCSCCIQLMCTTPQDPMEVQCSGATDDFSSISCSACHSVSRSVKISKKFIVYSTIILLCCLIS